MVSSHNPGIPQGVYSGVYASLQHRVVGTCLPTAPCSMVYPGCDRWYTQGVKGGIPRVGREGTLLRRVFLFSPSSQPLAVPRGSQLLAVPPWFSVSCCPFPFHWPTVLAVLSRFTGRPFLLFLVQQCFLYRVYRPFCATFPFHCWAYFPVSLLDMRSTRFTVGAQPRHRAA